MQNGCHDFETATLRKMLICRCFASTLFSDILVLVYPIHMLIAPPAAITHAAGYNTRPRPGELETAARGATVRCCNG